MGVGVGVWVSTCGWVCLCMLYIHTFIHLSTGALCCLLSALQVDQQVVGALQSSLHYTDALLKALSPDHPKRAALVTRGGEAHSRIACVHHHRPVGAASAKLASNHYLKALQYFTAEKHIGSILQVTAERADLMTKQGVLCACVRVHVCVAIHIYVSVPIVTSNYVHCDILTTLPLCFTIASSTNFHEPLNCCSCHFSPHACICISAFTNLCREAVKFEGSNVVF